MPRYAYCLFDLDGTLTDPGEGITRSVAYALSFFGIEVKDRTALYPFIGGGRTVPGIFFPARDL